ncbi:MAG: tRNA preQ1(34) S-adenosylmethionine ribosyltransferase-isomerase QueA [Acidobacteria bacterium]|nr:tRNA preQ1(34) S-adenosylmethionine ribosyltransferase-isomerase QueA [Acidobacteriota bacterium]
MRVSDFDYQLPEELIAQEPLADRDASRMLVIDRASGTWRDDEFRRFPSYVGTGDCLVLNDSRVIPARLHGHRRGLTGHVEVLLVKPVAGGDGMSWLVLARPGRKLRTGEVIEFGNGLECTVTGRNAHGERLVRFQCEGPLEEKLEQTGHVPLPPYIRRADTESDRERYQTVYAQEPGSAAAPTAGLHFTPPVLNACRARGVEIARVTLHVGLGTFQPVKEDDVGEVKLHAERFSVSEEASRGILAARRVVCVGTTSCRTVETTGGRPGSGDTSLFIAPGHRFQVAGALLTNFHLPRSSLLLLVAAFGGWELVRAAYEHAVRERYRFYSYGDCMLIQ